MTPESQRISIDKLGTYMNEEEQRIKIAEACGWKIIGTTVTKPNGERFHGVSALELICPDYLNDLNAMHESEKVLGPFGTEIWAKYARNIRQGDIVALSGELIHATAAQRAEAFLKTLGLWKEEPVSEATVEGIEMTQ